MLKYLFTCCRNCRMPLDKGAIQGPLLHPSNGWKVALDGMFYSLWIRTKCLLVWDRFILTLTDCENLYIVFFYLSQGEFMDKHVLFVIPKGHVFHGHIDTVVMGQVQRAPSSHLNLFQASLMRADLLHKISDIRAHDTVWILFIILLLFNRIMFWPVIAVG